MEIIPYKNWASRISTDQEKKKKKPNRSLILKFTKGLIFFFQNNFKDFVFFNLINKSHPKNLRDKFKFRRVHSIYSNDFVRVGNFKDIE